MQVFLFFKFCYNSDIMKKKYYLWVLGCQMNKSDAERIAAILNKAGYQETKNELKADLIITLACSVRQSAVDRIYGKYKVWQKIKKHRPLLTALTGCVLEKDKEKMSEIFDLFFTTAQMAKLPALLKKNGSALAVKNYFQIHPVYQTSFQAYVPISTGCNNFCTYCVVPYVRGREKSRPATEIIKECRDLIKQGYKEITLLGQNVNSYGHDLKTKQTFAELLSKIAKLPGDFWLRFATSHPKDLNNDLIKVMANNKNICNYLHLPVQAGDNLILKKMNRKYTREHYIKLIKKVRKNIPDMSLSTDVIVGFPGETKKQFANTAKLFREIKFDMAYIAQYSPRPQTTAYNLKDNVSKTEKKRREKVLNQILKKTALVNNKRLIGKTLEVLVESKKNNFYYGKTKTFKTVKFKSNLSSLTGKFVKINLTPGTWCWVQITKVQDFGLEGKICQ